MHRLQLPFYALILFVLFSIPTPTAQGANTSFPEVMIILDGSGSMWGNAGSQTKIKAAKDVLHPGFDLIDNTTGKPSLQIKRRWDNDYPIWYASLYNPETIRSTFILKA